MIFWRNSIRFYWWLFSFNSNGSNDLNNTNQLTTKLTNNLSYGSWIFYKNGLKNNFNINFKNLNSMEKIWQIINLVLRLNYFLFWGKHKLAFKKKMNNNLSFLTPKLSLRFNPGDMKNHNNSARQLMLETCFQ